MGPPFDRCNHRHVDIRQVLKNLNTLVVHLTPYTRVGDIPE